MARYVYGERIGATATLRAGVSAFIRNAEGNILLTRRTDNGRWCLPGGAIDPGESAIEACAREVLEETGLTVEVGRLIGVYSTPHRITIYADENRVQFIVLSFAATVTGGTLGLSDETTEAGYFSVDDIASMDIIEPHVERIADALADTRETIVK